MSFQVHTPDTAPRAARDTLGAIEERYGFIPNLAGVFAESPATFKALLDALQAYDSDELTLTPLERQVVQIAVAVENRCDYCTAAHSMLANTMGLSREQIVSLQRQEALADERLEALRSYTTSIVAKRGWVDEDETESFLAAGFTNAQVFEILQGVAVKTLTNYANHIAKPEVNAQFREFLPNWADAA